MQVTLQHVVQVYCKSKLKLREKKEKKKVSVLTLLFADIVYSGTHHLWDKVKCPL